MVLGSYCSIDLLVFRCIQQTGENEKRCSAAVLCFRTRALKVSRSRSRGDYKCCYSLNGWRASVAPELGASLWTRLQVCANHAAMALARMHEHPLLPRSADELVETSEELESAWLALIHPDVYYLSIPEELKKNWSDIDVLLQPELEKFNAVSKEYNQAIDMFPASLIAKLFNFKPVRILN